MNAIISIKLSFFQNNYDDILFWTLFVFRVEKMGLWFLECNWRFEEEKKKDTLLLYTMPSFPRSSSLNKVLDTDKKTNTMVYLNVYDLTPANNYLYMFGVGIFHSGIEGLFINFLFLPFLLLFGNYIFYLLLLNCFVPFWLNDLSLTRIDDRQKLEL